MKKTLTLLLAFMIISLLFYFMGLTITCNNDYCEGETISGSLLNYIFNPESIQQLSLGSQIAQALAGVVLAGITIGLFIAGKPDLAIAAPMAALLISLGFDFLAVFNKVFSDKGLARIISLFLVPIFVLFIIMVFDWWRGQDI